MVLKNDRVKIIQKEAECKANDLTPGKNDLTPGF